MPSDERTTSATTTPRQTRSFLMRRFEEVGIRPDTRHGQNFLIDLNLLQLLYSSADLGPRDVVLEVGTGTGSLTALMAPRVAAVVTVEIDRRMFQLASEELAQFENVTMLRADVLRNKNNFNPEVFAVVDERLAADPARQFKLVANLPYNVATPIISNCLSLERPPVSMTVTIQKELADRILARPSTKDYGALSVWVQSQCRGRLVRVMPPEAFWPRPKVHSAILHLELDEELRGRIGDREFFHRFVRAVFLHRRKFLRSVVCSALKNQLTKPQVDEVLARQGHGPDRRAEQLEVEELLALCEALRARIEPGTSS